MAHYNKFEEKYKKTTHSVVFKNGDDAFELKKKLMLVPNYAVISGFDGDSVCGEGEMWSIDFVEEDQVYE